MRIISINGEFYARSVTGIERVARALVKELDTLLETDHSIQVELVISLNATDVPLLKNIKVVQLPVTIGFFPRWTQVSYAFYVAKNHRLSLDFANTCPYFSPGIAYIHDIYAVLYKDDYNTTFRSKLIALYSRLMYCRIAKKASLVITVSNFSKQTIVSHYKIKAKRVAVVSAGYIKSSTLDDAIFSEYPILKEKPFYFTLGSLSKRKNIEWIVKHASLYPDELFVVSGKALPKTSTISTTPPNIILAGYLNDPKVHSLFQKCKAFLFPSYFEGFGIPPLEAMSFGAKAIVSNISTLKEVYGNTVYYIDPAKPEVNLDEILKAPIQPCNTLLQTYTLQNSAKRLFQLIIDTLVPNQNFQPSNNN